LSDYGCGLISSKKMSVSKTMQTLLAKSGGVLGVLLLFCDRISASLLV
jgi:hypothetical protein